MWLVLIKLVDDGGGVTLIDGLARSVYLGRTIIESYAIINTW